ncbi:MAG: fibro-slime domain-containing protein [Myxococcales bacterium]|nr:fibro-slime domain-containing protein [Myxococcales bacterium]
MDLHTRVCIGLLAALPLGACGGDDGGDGETTAPTTVPTTMTAGATTTAGTTTDATTTSPSPSTTTSDDTTGGVGPTATSDAPTTAPDPTTGVGPTGDDTTTGDATGDDTTGEPPPPCGTILVTYRDFRPLHTDFGCHMKGHPAWPGLVLPDIGPDQKPQYNPNPPPPPNGWNGVMPQITSAASFSEWYNTTADVNLEIAGELELAEIMPGIYSFSSDAFYPLTDMGFGNNTTPNWEDDTFPDINGAFTTEIHTSFVYEVGQQFSFSGDDDVWVYIDGKLAMDLGGLHAIVEGTIDLDDLGLTPGQAYTLDAFHAERCDSGSNFRIDTSIACFVPG